MASSDSSSARLHGHFILLHETDNILVCARTARVGTTITIDGAEYLLAVDVPLGHKIARSSLARGDKVLRYGIAIGSMTQAARPGDHVHSHNLASDYIPAHGREASSGQAIRS